MRKKKLPPPATSLPRFNILVDLRRYLNHQVKYPVACQQQITKINYSYHKIALALMSI